ncbi:MAG: GDSL-type esterase/lipase family protein [Ramlibacter sp.]
MSLHRRSFLLASLATAALAACGRRPKLAPLAAGATVLALGDSITWGTGAPREASYPAVLAQLTGWNVVNAGVPGDTSAGALERLPALLEQHAPALVLVSIGGNDFLRRLAPAETRANIAAICRAAAAAGAQVLLVAVPEANALAAVARSLGDHAMYAELAAELKVPLHAGGWAGVLSDPALRSDPIHANAQGYGAFARGLHDTLRALGLHR